MRMTDIYKMVIKKHTTANIKVFFVRNNCYSNSYKNIYKNISDITEDLGKKFKEIAKEDSSSITGIIKDKITKKLKIVSRQSAGNTPTHFHAKFIGCTCKHKAEVLVTSANFSDSHFDIDNYESVLYYKMTKEQFCERFVKDLESLETQTYH